MCRFVVYLGPPMTLDLLTTRPEHSIIRQSFKSRLSPEPLNGDGFGIAWYVPEISPEPALFRSIQPAWNNVSLLHVARVSRSPVILAHVRAATGGFSVSEPNCHPFTVGRYCFMHNGSVAEFAKLKRRMRSDLSDENYLAIHGSTDSEHLFARFRHHVEQRRGLDATAAMAEAMAETLADVKRMTKQVHAKRRSLLNMAVCDGQTAVVSRYATLGSKAPSLWLRTGSQYVCEDGVCHMLDGGLQTAAIVASEPLTEESGWEPVPDNHLVIIHPDRHVEMRQVA